MFFKKKKIKKDDHLQSTTAINVPEDLKKELSKLKEKQIRELQDKKEKNNFGP